MPTTRKLLLEWDQFCSGDLQVKPSHFNYLLLPYFEMPSVITQTGLENRVAAIRSILGQVQNTSRLCQWLEDFLRTIYYPPAEIPSLSEIESAVQQDLVCISHHVTTPEIKHAIELSQFQTWLLHDIETDTREFAQASSADLNMTFRFDLLDSLHAEEYPRISQSPVALALHEAFDEFACGRSRFRYALSSLMLPGKTNHLNYLFLVAHGLDYAFTRDFIAIGREC